MTVIGWLLPAAVLAQEVTEAEARLTMMRFTNIASSGIVIALALGLLVLPLVFWVAMIMDCAKREWPEKNMWLIVLILSLFFGLHLVSALLYYFLVKKKGPGGPKKPAAPKPPPFAV